MEPIRIRISEAIARQWQAASLTVQAITRDFLLLYASTEELAEPTAFISKQAQHMLDSVTDRILFNNLCAIVNSE
jgi:hypothetical protein